MAHFYSPSRAAFFDNAINVDIPDDAVPVTPARHRELMDGQSKGGAIVAGDDGKPRLQAKPRPSLADRRARLLVRIRAEAYRRIEAASPIWRQLNDMRDPSPEGAARFLALDAIRAASNRIEALAAQCPAAAIDAFPVGDNPEWPET